MPNDAMMITIDRIRFTYLKAKKMRVYAVGIAADNEGKVLVTEPPASASIRHRPKVGRPAVWDFAGDGYPVYQRTNGLADIIVCHVLVVRDRRATCRAGEIIQAVGRNQDAKNTIQSASKLLANLSPTGMAAANALNLLLPVANVVGGIISEKKDRVLQAISGSMFLDEDRRNQDHFSQTVVAPDGNLELDADVFLFDARTDEESTADTSRAETRLRADGLLFTDEDASN